MRSTSLRPDGSKRLSSTFSAFSEKRAKLIPSPSQVAPRGYGSPGQTTLFCSLKSATSQQVVPSFLGIRLQGSDSLLKPQSFFNIIAASGGNVSESEYRRPCAGTFSALTASPLPTPLPP